MTPPHTPARTGHILKVCNHNFLKIVFGKGGLKLDAFDLHPMATQPPSLILNKIGYSIYLDSCSVKPFLYQPAL